MANPYRLTGNASLGGGRRRSGCFGPLLLLALIGGGAGAGYYVVESIGHEGAALDWLGDCSAAIEALGEPISKNPIGWSCGRIAMHGNPRDAIWSLAVKGSHGVDGNFGFHAEQSPEGWHVTHGWLSVAGESVDLSGCFDSTSTKSTVGSTPESGSEGEPEDPQPDGEGEIEEESDDGSKAPPSKKKRPKGR